MLGSTVTLDSILAQLSYHMHKGAIQTWVSGEVRECP